jgi:hypothetical protein
MIYTAPLNVFDAGRYITRGSGRGMGPGNGEFFGPCEMASSRQASAIWGPKNVMYLPASKICIPPYLRVHTHMLAKEVKSAVK